MKGDLFIFTSFWALIKFNVIFIYLVLVERGC